MNIKQVWYAQHTDITSPDSIHQILMFGGLKDIRLLKKKVGEKTIKKLFLTTPKKIYTPAALHFIKNIVLKITSPIDEQKYLKNTPRNTR